MSDQERPLSRRERRAQEQREAQRLDDTAPLEPGLDTEGLPLFGPDGRALSRRERRRLERLNNPVETWTAEEEMIATGQIPAMTPERIAEQERIAREKAEAAQREARTASAEILRVSDQDVAPGDNQGDDDDDDQGNAESPEHAAEPVAPRRESLIPESSAPEVPAEPDAVHDVEPEQDTHAEHGTDDSHGVDTEGAGTAAPPVEPTFTDEPVSDEVPADADDDAEAGAAEAAGEATREDPQPEPLEQAPSPQTPLGMPPGMSPEMFAMLFPPGSAQRRLMEEHATAASAPSAHSAPQPQSASAVSMASAASAASVTDVDAPVGDEPQDDPSHTDGAAHAAADVEPHSPEAPEPWGYEPAEAERPVDMWAQVASQSHQQPATEPMADLQQGEPSFEQILNADDAALEDAPSTGAVPAFVPVSAASSDHDPVDPSGAAHASSGHADRGAPSPWDSHPLMTAEVPQVTGELHLDLDDDSLDAEPLPRPDLSGVHTSTNPAPAHVEPVPTGNFSVEPREKPELHPAGGAHHFGWAQLAVIGAVAFVLGVIVWNVLKGS